MVFINEGVEDDKITYCGNEVLLLLTKPKLPTG
jgi:hypothetical protein